MFQHQITADWTQSVAARRILASFAKHEPQAITLAAHQRWDGRSWTYAGYRVECLRRLWNEYGEKLIGEFDATGDYAPVAAFFHQQPSVEAAIDAARVLS